MKILKKIIVILTILLVIVFMEPQRVDSHNSTDLKQDGYVCFHSNDPNIVFNYLPPNYQFLDYSYTIKSNALQTFHRDVTSSKHNYRTQHPTYTLITYQKEGDLLSLCPASHNTYPFVFSLPIILTGKNASVLFDCDVLHAGCINKCAESTIIQYKLCHKNDIQKMQHLNGIHITKTAECQDNLTNTFARILSYLFQFPINYIFYPLISTKHDGFAGYLQSFVPEKWQFYNNPY